MKTPRVVSAMTLCGLIVLTVAAVSTARADEESPRLAPYHDRVDRAIDRGLRFLSGLQVTPSQVTDGQNHLVGSFRGYESGNTGISSLVVMAFLSKGHVPGSGRYGQLINRGIDYVLANQYPEGLLASLKNRGGGNGIMYAHSISTLLLAEASGMVDSQRQKRIDEVLPKALALLLRAQRVNKPPNCAGGWRYQPDSTDSDLSLTGWSIMALRAGRLNGSPVPKENIQAAVQYILKCRHKQQGGFAYQPGGGPTVGLTGCAVLCLELCGEHGNTAIPPAGDFLLEHLPTKNDGDMKTYYAFYYDSQAAFQLGGRYWETWAPRMYDLLLESQQPNGSWPGGIGPSYSTAMSILAMTVSYRQLPIYQRDDTYDQPAARR